MSEIFNPAEFWSSEEGVRLKGLAFDLNAPVVDRLKLARAELMSACMVLDPSGDLMHGSACAARALSFLEGVSVMGPASEQAIVHAPPPGVALPPNLPSRARVTERTPIFDLVAVARKELRWALRMSLPPVAKTVDADEGRYQVREALYQVEAALEVTEAKNLPATQAADSAFDANGKLHPTITDIALIEGRTGGDEAVGWTGAAILAFTQENAGRLMQYPCDSHPPHWRGILLAGVDVSAPDRLRVRLRKEGTTAEDDFHTYVGEARLLVFLDGAEPRSATDWLAGRKS